MLEMLSSVRKAASLAVIAAVFEVPGLHAATFTWDGGGADDNWTTADNWNPSGAPGSPFGHDLVFGAAGSARKATNTNDFAGGTGFNLIQFNNTGAGGFTLNGNAIQLGAGGIDNSASAANTVNLAGITLTANQDWFTSANGLQTIASPIDLNGFSLTSSVYGFGTSRSFTGAISGTGGVINYSNGQMTLSGNNSYAGDTTVASNPDNGKLTITGNNATIGNTVVKNTGTLTVGHNNALGVAPGNTLVFEGGTGTITATGGTITISNPVTFNATVNLNANLTLNGAGTLASNTTIAGSGANRHLAGDIGQTGGARSLTISLPNAGIRISGNNTYSGGFFMTAQSASNTVLEVGSDTAFGTGLATFTNSGAGRTSTLTAVSGDRNYANDLSLAVVGTFIVNGSHAFAGSTTLNNNHSIQVNPGGMLALNGPVGGAFSITKSGAGILLLNSTVAGGVTVNAGTLGGNATITGAVSVASAATLAPGNSPGILTTGALTFAGGANYTVELNGFNAGTGYDRVSVIGGVSLGGANLVRTLGFDPAGLDARLFIVANDDSDAISGTFAGLANNATFNMTAPGGIIVPFQISYFGDSGTNALTGGNDVVVFAIPEPASLALLAVGGWMMTQRRRARRA